MIFKKIIASIVFGAVPICFQAACIAQGLPAAAPVPPVISQAKSVFLANGGGDSVAIAAFNQAGDPNLGFNDFYAAMKTWGRYALAASPEQADLVVEARWHAPLGTLQTPDPYMQVRIYDVKTHFVLWSFTEPLGSAIRKASFEKNIVKGVDQAITSFKTIAGPVPAP